VLAASDPVLVKTRSEVLIVGGGPAGIVAAIAAAKRGLQATVVDARTPPIDKPCGECILPQGVAALNALGISLPSEIAFPFRGFRFLDEEHSAGANFSGATGYTLRRVKLHQLLVHHAIEAGVEFHWGARVLQVDRESVTTVTDQFSYRWLVGADGQNSQIRKWAGLNSPEIRKQRFGFCSHFAVKPWSDCVEVYWARGCQMFITPIAGKEIGVAVLTSDPSLRLAGALEQFPVVAEKLRGAARTTRESGDTTSVRILPAVAQGRVALVGDASGTVDALTGYGLSLSFQQANHLAAAMKCGDLAGYQTAHAKIATVPVTMARLMLLMERSDWIRRKTIRLFQQSPRMFARMLAIHAEAEPLSSVRAAELAGFGWKFLWT
jgi:flavin-dependent dehydrogenase